MPILDAWEQSVRTLQDEKKKEEKQDAAKKEDAKATDSKAGAGDKAEGEEKKEKVDSAPDHP